MHGYGYPPELPTARPSSTALTVLRVVFVALTVLSCSFLAWTAMLRLAIVTRRPRDWVLFVLSLALTAGLVAYTTTVPDDQEELTDAQAVAFLGWVAALIVGVTWYYLQQDIRHFGPHGPRAVAARAGAVTGYPPTVPVPVPVPALVQGYGYPHAAPVHPAPPYGAPPVPHHPQGGSAAPYRPAPPQQHPVQQHPVQPHPQTHLQPTPPPPPKRPGPPQRLDQVRAELDELSDYLRKEGEGR